MDPWVTPERHPDGTYKLPWGVHAATPPASNHPNEIGQDIHGPLPVDSKPKLNEERKNMYILEDTWMVFNMRVSMYHTLETHVQAYTDIINLHARGG